MGVPDLDFLSGSCFKLSRFHWQLACISILREHHLGTMVNRRISTDLKECALRLWELGWEELDIIQGLVVSRSSIYRWRNIFDKLGTVNRPPSPLHGRVRIISRVVLTAVHDIYKGDPDIYLDELVFWLAIHHDIVILKSALHKNLEEASLTRKLLHKIARERDEQLRQEYWDVINGDLDGNSDLLVMVDETSKNDLTLARRFGRAVVGQQAMY
jgi:transposase